MNTKELRWFQVSIILFELNFLVIKYFDTISEWNVDILVGKSFAKWLLCANRKSQTPMDGCGYV